MEQLKDYIQGSEERR